MPNPDYIADAVMPSERNPLVWTSDHGLNTWDSLWDTVEEAAARARDLMQGLDATVSTCEVNKVWGIQANGSDQRLIEDWARENIKTRTAELRAAREAREAPMREMLASTAQ